VIYLSGESLLNVSRVVCVFRCIDCVLVHLAQHIVLVSILAVVDIHVAQICQLHEVVANQPEELLVAGAGESLLKHLSPLSLLVLDVLSFNRQFVGLRIQFGCIPEWD